MPLDNLIKNVLVIGSGPVIIGQAAEFDYSGSQACLAAREEGIRTVLLNPNPATIQTDHSIADRIYIEPINPEIIRKIVSLENIDSIIASVGGQTALNSVLELKRKGYLEDNIRVLGTQPEFIRTAENREDFHILMRQIGEPIPDSYILDPNDYKDTIKTLPASSYIVRTSYSLGGSGGTIVKDLEDLSKYAETYFDNESEQTLEIEKSIVGLKEIEYEMIRDSAGNCISICNMENLDPMGIHTGESIVVTPSQTLSDIEIQMLRSAAIRIVRALEITGACNVQFAIDSTRGEYYVIEVNPRTSRSSALASKATGYPIARIATKIQLGYTLAELRNPLTKNTSAAFEPSLDYITVKIPRWPFDKITVSREIGVSMRSVGEVMGIGATFEEALMKAIASLDTAECRRLRLYKRMDDLIALLKVPTDLRIYAIFESLLLKISTTEIADMTGYDIYFIEKMKNISTALEKIQVGIVPENLLDLKRMGVSDAIISHFSRIEESQIIKFRLDHGMAPAFRAVDTCSAEFASSTPYLYSTYFGEDENIISENRKVVILGSGPNRIAQGLEFDYGCVKASLSLKKMGLDSIILNSNPETVSTDFDFSGKLYFEPVTLEHVVNVLVAEKLPRIMIQFSGQTGQNMSAKLSDLFGESIFLGTQPSDIAEIEERSRFAESMKTLGLKQPDYAVVKNEFDAETVFERIKMPVIIRSSFIIGGRSMDIVYQEKLGIERIKESLTSYPEHPVLISKYIPNASEIDVDFISDGINFAIGGISIHMEEAGTHSGDAISLLGPSVIDAKLELEISEIVGKLVSAFSLKGLSNLQLAVNEEGIFIIELNARASRSIPYVSKAIGVDLVELGVSMSFGQDKFKRDLGRPTSYFCKIPVFPFNRFPEADVLLSPEMKSTGEALGIGKTMDEAVVKAFNIQNKSYSSSGGCIISVSDANKASVMELARLLSRSGITLYCTPGTNSFLRSQGIGSVLTFRIGDSRRPTVKDVMENQDLMAVINLPDRSTGAIADGFEIRRLALSRNIPLLTNLSAARALIPALIRAPDIVPRELSEYY